MKSLASALFLFSLLTAWPIAAVSAPAPAFQLSDVQKLVSLSEPQISPDGRQIAVIVSTPDWETDKPKQELDLVDTASGTRRALTWDREEVSAVRWSPDGTRLAFLAEDPQTKKPQIFVMPMNGGDAKCITDDKQGVDTYSWSPDGRHIAFIAQDPPLSEKAIKQHDKVFQVTDGNFLLKEAVAPWQLWVVPAAGGQAKQLTEGAFSLDTDQGGATPPAWSRDGRRIAFTKFPSPYWGPSFHSVIAEVGVSGGTPAVLVADQGAVSGAYAPDSEDFAFQRPRHGDENNGNAVYVSFNGKIYDASAALARNFNFFHWLPDGKALVMQGELGTRSVLWRQPLSGNASLLDLGDVNADGALSVSKTGSLAFIGSTATHPGELYVMDSVHAQSRRLTDVNAFVDGLSLGRTESIEWRGPNGFHEDGVLTYPVGYEPGHKYPLVLVIHGGPEGASTVGFSPLTQLLAAAGFLVFQPNYRGSINLGDQYQHAIYRDTGKGPGKDVMAGLAAVEKLGIVDKNNIGVTGWSYGGYMTTWLSGHYNVWKAAVAGAPLTDWVMDYTIAYYQTGDRYFFGSSPWTDAGWKIWR
ncbi:MAG: S9 family peptidase, partial [Gammaproteobacteria bacterium]|nr:S9 family peptidase [Gammaproteobacteria bacterium]